MTQTSVHRHNEPNLSGQKHNQSGRSGHQLHAAVSGQQDTVTSKNSQPPSSPRYNLRNRSTSQAAVLNSKQQHSSAQPIRQQLSISGFRAATDSRPRSAAHDRRDESSVHTLRLCAPIHSRPGTHSKPDFVDTGAWNRHYGYESEPDSVTPLETLSETEMASSLLESSVPPTEATSRPPDANKKLKAIDARNSLFYNGLLERNIDFDATTDKAKKWIEKILKLHTKPVKSTKQQEENWKRDLDHCKESDEAMFQRTAMMELLDRHQLNACLDYICETSWTCARMPRKRPEGAAELAQPKPDLAVAFSARSLISQRELRSLAHLKGFICPEASKEKKDTRAFHFFAMEAKGVDAKDAKNVANRQNFNTASQALHNMYEVMRRAGQEDPFFEKVRVFTAVATAEFFQVRVHRAEKLDKPRDFIEPDYPLEFKFDEVIRISDSEYTRSRVLSIVHNILFAYGVESLRPLLKTALSVVLERLDKATDVSRKRPAQEHLESFDSSRARLDALDMEDGDLQRREIQLAA